ncbi:MAG: hypothetical protein ABJD11_14950 [Gemmatimonadota bacterium]
MKAILRNRTLLIALPLFAAAFTACDKRSAQNASADAQRAGDAVGDAASEGWTSVKVGARRAGDYTFAQREEFRSSLNTRLVEMDRGVQNVEDQLKKNADPIRQRAVDNFKQARAKAHDSFEKLESATDATWSDARAEAGRALSQLQVAYDDVVKGNGAMGGNGPVGKDSLAGKDTTH